MSYTIEIAEEFDDEYALADGLQRIQDLVRSGYTSGVDPAWSLSGEREPDDDTCEFPECDRFKRDGDDEDYCEFHHLNRLRAQGETIPESEMERAFFAD